MCVCVCVYVCVCVSCLTRHPAYGCRCVCVHTCVCVCVCVSYRTPTAKWRLTPTEIQLLNKSRSRTEWTPTKVRAMPCYADLATMGLHYHCTYARVTIGRRTTKVHEQQREMKSRREARQIVPCLSLLIWCRATVCVCVCVCLCACVPAGALPLRCAHGCV